MDKAAQEFIKVYEEIAATNRSLAKKWRPMYEECKRQVGDGESNRYAFRIKYRHFTSGDTVCMTSADYDTAVADLLHVIKEDCVRDQYDKITMEVSWPDGLMHVQIIKGGYKENDEEFAYFIERI